jgi:hypothetical protein
MIEKNEKKHKEKQEIQNSGCEIITCVYCKNRNDLSKKTLTVRSNTKSLVLIHHCKCTNLRKFL